MWSAGQQSGFCGMRKVRGGGEEIREVKGPDGIGGQFLLRVRWEPLENFEQRGDMILCFNMITVVD